MNFGFSNDLFFFGSSYHERTTATGNSICSWVKLMQVVLPPVMKVFLTVLESHDDMLLQAEAQKKSTCIAENLERHAQVHSVTFKAEPTIFGFEKV